MSTVETITGEVLPLKTSPGITIELLTALEGRVNTLATLAVQLSPETAQPVVDEVYAAITQLKQAAEADNEALPAPTDAPLSELEEIL